MSDGDAGQSLTLSLAATGGSFRNLADADLATAGVIELNGTVSAINAALAAGSFVASADGAASISASVTDGVIGTPVTATYTLTASNAAPTLTLVNALTGKEDQALAISFADLLASADEADSNGSVMAFEVTAVDATKGTLTIGGSAWNGSSNKLINTDLGAVWTPFTDLNGTPVAGAFQVKAIDNGGLASSSSVAVAINVAAVNDAPTISGVPTVSTAVNTGVSNALVDFTVADIDSNALTLTLVSSNGSIGNLTDVDGTRSGIQLTGSASSITAALVNATFSASTSGAASIDLQLDDGGTELVKASYSFSATKLNSAPSLVSPAGSPLAITTNLADTLSYITVSDGDAGQSLTLSLTATGGSFRNLADADPTTAGLQLSGTVSAINAALAAGSFVASADGAASIAVSASDGIAPAVSATYTLSASNVAPSLSLVSALSGGKEDQALAISFADLLASADEADSNGSVMAFEVTAVDATKGTLTIGGSAWNGSSNKLINTDLGAVWTPFTDLNGTPVAGAFQVKAIDNGGLASSSSVAVAINVAAVNDAPSLSAGSYTFTGVSEDTSTTGVAISSLLASRASDREAASLGIAIEAASGLGSWQFSSNGGGSWTALGTVATSAALLLANTSLVRYVPDGTNGENGGSAPTLIFRAWDGSDGSTLATRVDVSSTGGASAFSSGTNTASVSVTAVDDPLTLSLSHPAAVTYLENDQYLLDAGFSLDDPDSNTSVTGAKIEISAATYRSGEDYLEVAPANRSSGTATNGTMVINGSTISYSFSSGLMSLSGTSSQESYQEALRRISYRNSSENPNTSAREITATAGSMLVQYLTDADNIVRPHFYEYVTVSGSGISWTNAKDSAQARTYAGMQGYLATITSSTESNYIKTRLGGAAWIGASDAASEGTWMWVTGPEADTTFWRGNWSSSTQSVYQGWFTWADVTTWSLSGTGAVSGVYSNWATHQPNNTSGEDYAQILADGTGDWNDLDNSNYRSAYLVEYSSPSVTSISFSKTITLTPEPQNDAPVLASASPILTAITEDATAGAGQLVSSEISSSTITDVDTGALRGGIAIIDLSSGNGTWQYRLNNSGNWLAMGGLSASASLLLRPADAVRFLPDGENATSANFTYRAWDQSSGSAGSLVDTSETGGSSAFSLASNTASITVTSVNDAPSWGVTTPYSIDLGTVTRGDTSNAGVLVSSLVGSGSDPDQGASPLGVYVFATNEFVNGIDIGNWEMSTNNGANWSSIQSNVQLAPAYRLRFNQLTADAGSVKLLLRLWDQTSGSAGSIANPISVGGSTAYSSDFKEFNFTVSGITLSGVASSLSLTEGQSLSPASSISLSAGTLSSARVMIASGLSAGDVLSYTPPSNSPITASYDASTGVLLLSGTADSSVYQAALQAVSLTVGNDPTQFSSTRQIAYLLDNQTSSTAYTTVTVSAVADAPVLSAASGVTYLEGGSAVSLHPSLSLSDADDFRIASATVTISSIGRTTGDLLHFTGASGSPIAGSYTSGTGVLSLSGTASLAEYQTALRSITFENSTSNPTNSGAAPSRTISFAVSDANSDGLGAASASSVVTLNVTAINTAPALSAGLNRTYSEAGTAVSLDAGSTITISDGDDTNLSGAVLEIITGYTSGDLLAFTDINGISGSWDSNSHQLTLSGTSSLSNYQTALRAVTFSSSSADPTASSSSRRIAISVSDANRDGGGAASGWATSNTAGVDITITPTANAPVVTAGSPSASFTEAGSAVTLASALVLSDADDTQLGKAQVSISSGWLSGDQLAYTAVSGIGGSYDDSTGVLTLTGAASLADYQTVLRSITYGSSSSSLPASGSRTISWKALDANSDGLTPQWSTAVTSTVSVVGVNQYPVISSSVSVAASFQENDSPVALNNQFTLSDKDSSQASGATITITAGLTAGDTLALVETINGITASFNANTGSLSLSGAVNYGLYQQALRSVVFSSSSDNPTATSSSRTLQWQITDKDVTPANQASSDLFTTTINLTAVNDNPTLDVFTAGAVSGGEDSTITIRYGDLIGPGPGQAQVADVDGTVSSLLVSELLSGSLRLGSSESTATAYATGSNDTINATINAYWLPAANANGSGANALGAFSVVASDNAGALSIQPRSVLVDVTPDQSDAAVITKVSLPANGSYSTNQNLDFSVEFDRAVSVVTSGGTPSLLITLAGGASATATYQSGAGTGTLVFRYTVLPGDKDSNGLVLASAINLAAGASITSLDDGSAVAANLTLAGTASTAGLLIDGINDAPGLSAPTNGSVPYQEGDTGITLNPALVLSDSDSSQLSGALVSISSSFLAGDTLSLQVSVPGITATYNAATGMLSLVGNASLGDYQQALRAIAYSSSSSNPTATSSSRTISWQVTDLDNNSPATSTLSTSSITITPVNNNPTLVAFSPGAFSGLEDSTITLSYSDLIVAGSGTDLDGTVSSLLVKELLSGSLRLGSSEVAATAYATGSNDTINGSTNAYWTPVANANGSGANALGAFSVVAKDNAGALSIQPRTVLVNVTADQSDAAVITKVSLPANGSYSTNQNLDFSVEFDRAVSVVTSGGTPSLLITLDTGSGSSASYLSGSGTDTLLFQYRVRPGDYDSSGIALGAAITANGGQITSLDDGQPVACNLTLPNVSSTGGLLVDGINDAPELTSPPNLSVAYLEGDPALTLNPELALSDTDSPNFSSATVRISAGFTAGDGLALSAQVSGDTGVQASWNGDTGTLTLTPSTEANAPAPSLLQALRALRSVTFASSSEDPTASSTSRSISWQVSDSGLATSALASGSFTITPVNDAPTFSSLGASIFTTAEDNAAEITLQGLAAFSNASDVDGVVNAYVVQAVTSGSLRLGTTAQNATAWAASSNDAITSTVKAFWTPAADVNGEGLAAFTVVARDNGGAVSETPVAVMVDVTPVADIAQITGFQLPATGTYGIGSPLQFAISLDRAISLDPAGGLPSLTLQLDGNRSVDAVLQAVPDQASIDFAAGDQLIFAYTVAEGELRSSSGIALPSSLSLPGGSSLTNIDGGESADVILTLPAANGSGLLVDGVRPLLVMIKAAPGSESNRGVQTFRVSFSEPVRNTDAIDFRLTATGTASGLVSDVQAVNPINAVAANYDVTVSDISGLGRLVLELKSSGTGIIDSIGNQLAAGAVASGSIEVDRVGAISRVAGDDRLSLAEATNPSGVKLQGTVSQGVAAQPLQLLIGSSVVATITPASDGSWSTVVPKANFDSLGTGQYILSLKQGTTTLGTRELAIDRDPPTLSNPIGDTGNNPFFFGGALLNRSEVTGGLTIKGSSDAEDGQQVDVRLGSISGAGAVSNGSWQVQFTAAQMQTLSDGPLNLALSVSDLAGNLSNADYSLTLDTTAAVNLAPISTDGWINIAESSQAFSISGAAAGVQDGAIVNLAITSTAAGNIPPLYSSSSALVSQGSFSFSVPAQSWLNGTTYKVAVTGNDAAGNPFSALETVTVDTVAPTVDLQLVVGSAPPVRFLDASFAGQFAGAMNTSATLNTSELAAGVLLSSSASSDAATTVVSVNGSSQFVTFTSNNSTPSWSVSLDPARVSLPEEGAVLVAATVIDQAGNSASQSGTIGIDRSASLTVSGPVDGAGGDNTLNGAEVAAVTIFGTAGTIQLDSSASVLVEVLAEQATTPSFASSVALSSTSWSSPSLNLSSLADGPYSLRVSVSDGAGNLASASRSFAISAAIPLFTKTAMAGDSILNASDLSLAVPPSLSGLVSQAEDGLQVSVTLPGAGLGAGLVAGRNLLATVLGGVWNLAIPADLLAAYGANDGTYSVNLSLTNQVGNSGSAVTQFTVDAAAPLLTVTQPTDAQWAAAAANPEDNPITLVGTATGLEEGQVVTVLINGKSLQASRTASNPSQWSLALPSELLLKGLKASANSLEVRANDLAGNSAVLASSFDASGVRSTPPIIAIPSDRKVLADEGDGLIRQFQANQPVSWSLEGIDSTLVQINASTGSFSFRQPISLSDQQADLSLPFTLIATDGRGNRTSESLVLVVRNLADANSAAMVDSLDQDGITADVEDAATNGRDGISAGDLNNDGIPDKYQPNVAAVPWINQQNFQNAQADSSKAAANSFASLQSSPAVRITDVHVSKAEELAVAGNGSSALPALITTSTLIQGGSTSQGGSSQATITSPYDPLVFKLQSYDATSEQPLSSFIDAAPALVDGSDPYPGVQVRMTIDLPSPGLAINSYLKWDPSANNGSGGWFEFLADGDAATYDNGAELMDSNGDGLIDQIRLTYTDGNPRGGDSDGLVNGWIQDPGMPVLLQQSGQANQSAPTTVAIVTNGAVTQVLASFYGGTLASGSVITTDIPENLDPRNARQALGANDSSFKINGTAIAFGLTLNSEQSVASLYGDLDLVGGDLAITDAAGKRLSTRRLAYYGFDAGAAQPLIYNPISRAGTRFYDRNGDGIADYLSLLMSDGGLGDYGTSLGSITNASTAAVVDSTMATLTKEDSTTLRVADAINQVAPINFVLKASLKQRTTTVNQIGYVVLDSNEVGAGTSLSLATIKTRAQTLFSPLAAGDVTLALARDTSRFQSQREILLVNGQSVRFFEVSNGTIDSVLDLNDARLRFFSMGEITSQTVGNEMTQQSLLSSTTGVQIQLDLLASDQGLNALIGQEQGTAAVLDFSSFSGSETVIASLVMAREASYDSVTGFYRTLDTQGSVRDALGAILHPGDSGYAAAARLNLVAGLSSMTIANRQSTTTSLSLSESSFLAPMATVNGATYFAFADASSDQLNHFRVLGTNLFGLEDLAGLGDRDYNDLVFGFNFTMASNSVPI